MASRELLSLNWEKSFLFNNEQCAMNNEQCALNNEQLNSHSNVNPFTRPLVYFFKLST